MRSRDYYGKRRNPWVDRAIAAVLLAMLIYGAAQLISYVASLRQTQELQSELRAAIVTEVPSPAPSPTQAATPDPQATATPFVPFTTLSPWTQPDILLNYQALHERNSDFVGWLHVERLYRVDIPIVQRDQFYYLRRDFDGRSNINGTAFMDVTSSIWPRTDNLVIYAHNMKSGEMFGELHRLMEEPFYREAPITTFNTLYERGSYVPIAAMYCDVTPGDRFFNFATADFPSAKSFDKFIARARALSEITPPYDVYYGDQLLTLVTCVDTDSARRVVVILRRVRDGEDIEALRTMWQ